MPHLDFLLPSDTVATAIKVVQAIPNDWGWLNGHLVKTAKVDPSKLDPRAKTFTISRQGASESDRPLDPYQVCPERDLPHDVHFAYAGAMRESRFDLAASKKVVANYLHLGYSGHLTVYPGETDREKWALPEVCHLYFEAWIEPVASWEFDHSATNHPAMVRLVYADELLPSQLEPLIVTCRSLGLTALNE